MQKGEKLRRDSPERHAELEKAKKNIAAVRQSLRGGTPNDRGGNVMNIEVKDTWSAVQLRAMQAGGSSGTKGSPDRAKGGTRLDDLGRKLEAPSPRALKGGRAEDRFPVVQVRHNSVFGDSALQGKDDVELAAMLIREKANYQNKNQYDAANLLQQMRDRMYLSTPTVGLGLTGKVGEF